MMCVQEGREKERKVFSTLYYEARQTEWCYCKSNVFLYYTNTHTIVHMYCTHNMPFCYYIAHACI